jgi:CRISPR-associated endonuclease/helicase Cas3
LARAACARDQVLAATARAAGLLHDLGKYRLGYQQMIRGVPVQKELTYHKQAGAAKAFEGRNAPLAFAIVGHHGGMPDAAKLLTGVRGDNGQKVAAAVWEEAVQDCPELAGLRSLPPMDTGLDGDLLTRVLFSCLVDADWADTAEHYRRVRGAPQEQEPAPLDPAGWLERLLCFIRRRADEARVKSPGIASVRQDVLDACLAAAEHPRYLYYPLPFLPPSSNPYP